MLSFPLLCEIIANTDLPKAPEHKTGRHIMECPKIQINDIRPLRKTTVAFFEKHSMLSSTISGPCVT